MIDSQEHGPLSRASGRSRNRLKEELNILVPTAVLDVYEANGGPRIGLLRLYDPNLQRWINRDLIEEKV